MVSKLVASFFGLSVAVAGVSACAVDVEESAEVGTAEQDVKANTFCGGFAAIPCPEGQVCVDDPHDGCDPNHGGADCGGICKHKGPPGCSAKKKNQDKVYVAEGDTCMVIKFACEVGMEPFFDECGCGCQPLPGEDCNAVTCGAGEFCCNYSCSICAPEGGFCTQQFCG